MSPRMDSMALFLYGRLTTLTGGAGLFAPICFAGFPLRSLTRRLTVGVVSSSQ